MTHRSVNNFGGEIGRNRKKILKIWGLEENSAKFQNRYKNGKH